MKRKYRAYQRAKGVVFTSSPFSRFYMDHLTGSLYLGKQIMSLEVPGTSDLTKKPRVRGGRKSHVTRQSAVLLADQLSHEHDHS